MNDTSTATMRALQLDGPHELDDLKLREVPAPEAAPDRAIVEVAAAAVNRSDVLNAIGMMPITTYPRIPGRDFAGVVVDGPDGTVGMRCWGTGSGALGFSEDGSHAELLSVPAQALVPVPETMSLAEAGAAGLSYLVSSHGLTRAGLGDDPDQTVLVTGAAGGVGAAACAVALWRGAHVVAAVLDEGERDAVLARHPEATVAVSGGKPMAEVVLAASEGRGADIVYDTVGNPVFADCVASFAHGARMVVITAAPDASVPLDLFGFYRHGATLMSANSTSFDSAGAGERLRELLPGFESGALPAPTIAEEFELADCALAFKAVREGRRGRIVLRSGERER